ncbi:MAG: hypothetical protein GDA39_10235 [Hyphomonadaceae bacterium]|nr:hypothetical protein [Hyphomonadaceae bacterium]MBC6413205.1 hypothetical protein [Hyphomonadaceae bacterium]
MIESAGRLRRLIEGIAVDRAGEAVAGAAGGVVTECLWAAPDGLWSQSGCKAYFGYKGSKSEDRVPGETEPSANHPAEEVQLAGGEAE